ncbi:MAG: alcohol dehydrogenase catalytic domain-containing protein [Nitrospinota bacterium]|nr:alcohol dehydrogenase catalytic domain-containing protein [Nitrospinota bacterium]
MRALTFGAPEGLSLATGRPVPIIGPGEALIRPILAGVCSTDLEIAKGYMGFSGVLGHEFVGRVEKAPQSPQMEGKRVVGEINIPCGRCGRCHAGLGNHCATRSVLGIVNKDGVFADYFTLPISNLHLVPEEVADEEAVFTEPLAAAFRILEQVSPPPEARVAVLGVGRLGQLIARALAAEGLRVTAIARSLAKLDLLKNVQVNTALDGQMTERGIFPLVVDSTGTAEGIKRAMELVAPCGTIILKTTTATPAMPDLNRIVIDEIRVIGSRCGPFHTALMALKEKRVETTELIHEVMRLDQALEAMSLAAKPGVMKVLLKMND